MSQQLWATIRELRRLADESLSVRERECPALRCARQFAHVVEALPIVLDPHARFAGSIDLAALPELPLQSSADSSSGPATPEQIMRTLFHCFGGYSPAHTCVDYARVLGEGLAGIICSVQERQNHVSGSERDTLTAMGIALEAGCRWGERFAELARELSQEAGDEDACRGLREVAEACSLVPRAPATTFREALQSIWLIHVLVGLSEDSSSSLSLGRLDQYLFPFYTRDLSDGVSAADLRSQMCAFFRQLNTFGDAACAVNIGGLDAKGRDQHNALSELIVSVVTELGLASPILAIRVHDDVSEERFSAFLDPRLLSIGQPTFYGEQACRAAMRERAIADGECHDWAVNSCMGLVVPGREISNMWGGVVPVLLSLELAMNGGVPLIHALPIELEVDVPASYCSFDHFYGAFRACLVEVVSFAALHCKAATAWAGSQRPNPFLSGLIGDCIGRARDRADGGAQYHIAIIEAFGLVNAADALYAIRELVFKQQRWTLAEVVDALKADFDGAEDLLQAIRALPKYGNGNTEVDTVACDLSALFAEMVASYSDTGLTFAPSFHTLNAHVHAGSIAAASADGRRQGDPLAKNIGARPENLCNSHTGLTLSASSIDQSRFFGGQALDLSLDPAIVGTPEGRRKFRSLVDTYFSRGGLQIQVNGLSPALLRAAREHPEKHGGLTVRIGGYSARFVSLSSAVQDEMIARFENGV
ncbi:MAG: hypothetical protein HN742_12215 [Lentisphaerae bacterium]|jgi:pyruvate-formate lyase|nr:hypothetical protein [Lentisphaerota bacterium]MBT4815934.1 hypothetical protein [Lentisphaerota bacterium]MBT5607241.1 hypothetical protein [Lentisphaerota bacterium]MBT7057351.1 hypothetical protein [Lentisphaerota bacterium]MBT7842633.1 hypothetical protein [Lentisphaerota bacterium]